MGAAAAADPFVFFAENAGVEAAAVKYRVYGVAEHTFLGVNSINLRPVRSGFGVSTIRFAAGAPAEYRSLEPWRGVLNRFSGNGGEQGDWHRGIPAHRRIQYTSIAPGIDAVFGPGSGDAVPTLTFVVRQGGDPALLFLETDQPRATIVEATGAWVIGGIPGYTLQRPRAWQGEGVGSGSGGQTAVDARFRVASSSDGSAAARVGVTVGVFDRARPLNVEVRFPLSPIVQAGDDVLRARLLRDADGNTYQPAGLASDTVCTVTPGGTQNLCGDAGVSSQRPDGSPRFLTLLAGRYDQNVYAPLFLDREGNIVALGRTGSANFPVSSDAEQPAHSGPTGPFPRLSPFIGGDLFVSILAPDSGDLLYSSFLGGPDSEYLDRAMAGPDSSIAAAITTGGRFPTTPGAWLSGGGQSGVAVAVFDPSERRIRFATKLPDTMQVRSMRFGPDLSVAFGGIVRARGEAPVTEGALQGSYGGGETDGYIVRLPKDGSKPLFATYFGGEFDDDFGALDVAQDGSIWASLRRGIGRFAANHFLAHISADGSRLESPLVPIPAQFPSELRITGADGGGGASAIALLAATQLPAAPTTRGAPLLGACGTVQLYNYFQVFHPDGTRQFASYLDARDARSVEELYAGLVLRPAPAPTEPLPACVTGAADRTNRGRVSPGQIVAFLGTGLGPAEGVTAAPTTEAIDGGAGRYPSSLAGVRVLAGTTPMPLLYVQSGQINAIVPYSVTPGGKVTFTVEVDGKRAALTADAVVAELYPFSADGSGGGQAVAVNEDGTLNSAANLARAGSIVAVFATGGGRTVPPGVDGGLAPLGPLSALPRLAAGEVRVELFGYNGPQAFGEVIYAGAAPGLVNGVTQINFRLPGDRLPLFDGMVVPQFSVGDLRLAGAGGVGISIAVSGRL